MKTECKFKFLGQDAKGSNLHLQFTPWKLPFQIHGMILLAGLGQVRGDLLDRGVGWLGQRAGMAGAWAGMPGRGLGWPGQRAGMAGAWAGMPGRGLGWLGRQHFFLFFAFVAFFCAALTSFSKTA